MNGRNEETFTCELDAVIARLCELIQRFGIDYEVSEAWSVRIQLIQEEQESIEAIL